MKTFTKAACYVRVSTENQLENYSIEEQTERLRAYCNAKAWGIFNIYTDGGCSGGNINRPALKQMLDDIHCHKIDVVLVYKLDRLSRSQKDTLTLIEDEFLCNNVDFVSISENFDTSTAFGRAMIGVLSVFAQLEKDQITERFRMGRIARSKAGYYHGGAIIPTGYKYVEGKLVVDEYKALQVIEVFNKFLSGYSVNAIQKQMRAQYGGWKSHTAILGILRNNVYIGKVKFNKQTYDGVHQPLISQEDFEKAQLLLKKRTNKNEKSTPIKTPFRANYLLTSLIFCGKCGARYSAVQGHYKCYSRSKCDRRYVVDENCSNTNWEIEALDNVIICLIGKLRQDRDYVESLSLIRQTAPFINKTSLTSRIKEIEAQISKLIDLYQVKNIPINEISDKIDNLQKEKETLAIKASTLGDAPAATDNYARQGEFSTVLKKGTLGEKRLLVSCLIKSIIIKQEEIHINWRI